MWTAQYYDFPEPRRWINSGGAGTMGFGLPAAMGAQAGNPESLVVCISGDGSLQMNIQELATIAENNIPVKIFLMNNGFLGMVRQWQELFWDGRYSHVDMGNLPDWVKLADAYGIWARQETDKTKLVGDAQGGDRARRPGACRRPRHQGRKHVSDDSGRTGSKGHGGLTWAIQEPKKSSASPTCRRPASARWAASTSSRFSSRTSPACLPASAVCSPVAATTSTRSPSVRPTTTRSRASR